MRSIRRHVKANNVVVFTVLVKLRYCIAAIAIYNKESIRAYYTHLYMSIKVLQLVEAKAISCLTIIAYTNYLVA